MTLDLTGITTKAALHALFKEHLHFPDWYGANWDAFFDCVVAIVPMPTELRLTNWQEFAAAAPHNMAILHRGAAASYSQAKGPPGFLVASVGP